MLLFYNADDEDEESVCIAFEFGNEINTTDQHTEYDSFYCQRIKYNVGDDVVVRMKKCLGGWAVARITKVLHRQELEEKEDVNEIGILIKWFWRRSEVQYLFVASRQSLSMYVQALQHMETKQEWGESNPIPKDQVRIIPLLCLHLELRFDLICNCQIYKVECHELTCEAIKQRELHLELAAIADEITIHDLCQKLSSSKALVLSSSEEYAALMKEEAFDIREYFGAFWCTHGYKSDTHHKRRMHLTATKSHYTHTTRLHNKMNNDSALGKRSRHNDFHEKLMDAFNAMNPSSVPSKLPCRTKEHRMVHSFVKEQILLGGHGSALCMSGMPGMGKTETVRQVCKELQSDTELPSFRFIEINAFLLPTSCHMYSELHKKMFGKMRCPDAALTKLNEHFQSHSDTRETIVLLIDELDCLATKKQRVLYNLFDWPHNPKAKLVVIVISNTLDFPQRLLPRISSRMGTDTISFSPYVRDQLIQIIEHRLSGTNCKVFEQDAIRFCAAAVAKISGDCRTALQLCRAAIEMVQKEIKQHGVGYLAKETVDLKHMTAAKDLFDQSNDIQTVLTLSLYEKLRLSDEFDCLSMTWCMTMHKTECF